LRLDALDQAVQLLQKIQKTIMTAVTDLPRVITDTKRPLAEYDALEGDPIWLR